MKVDYGQFTTIITNLSVIAGIVFLGFELRQNSESERLQAAQSYANISHELDFRIVGDPTLVALFNTPAENRSPEQAFRLDRWYYGVFRTWENGFYLHSRGVLDDELWSGTVALIQDLITSSADFRTHFEANREYLSVAFVQFLDELIIEGSD